MTLVLCEGMYANKVRKICVCVYANKKGEEDMCVCIYICTYVYVYT